MCSTISSFVDPECVVWFKGEATLTDALTAAGKTYEDIAQMVAEQVLKKHLSSLLY